MHDITLAQKIEHNIGQRKLKEAESLLQQAIFTRPQKPVWINRLAKLYADERRVEHAYEVALKSYELDQNREDTLALLSSLAASLGKLNEQMDWALKAIALDPRAPRAYNNLGSALFSMGMFEEALIPFETAHALDPRIHRATANIGIIHHKCGRRELAIKYLEQARSQVTGDRDLRTAIDFYLSLDYLAIGELEKGWRLYDSGFSRGLPAGSKRSPQRSFNAPRWKGEKIAGKRLLVWREQGVGDELMFATCYADLAATGAHVIIECEPRFVQLFQKTFPDFTIRPAFHGPAPEYRSLQEDFDFQIPAGALPRIYRSKLQDFPAQNHRLYVDPEAQRRFRNLFGENRDQQLVGICWRSGLIDPVRRKSYSDILEWESILTRPGYRFVCLQYDECDDEIAAVKERFGVHILTMPGLDLKNDFIGVAALMSTLDTVVSVGTAVVPLAGFVGVKTYLLAQENAWTFLSGDYPWFDSVTPVTAPIKAKIAEAIRNLPETL